MEDPVYPAIMAKMEQYEIKALFYIGGNDSMDTVSKLSRYAAKVGIDICFVGVPKTIDNDLILTDHPPGYGSTSKYVAATVKEIVLDAGVYEHPVVTIVELMGRNAGWVTAAGVLARTDYDRNPLLVYLPESDFEVDTFVNDVKEANFKNVEIRVGENCRGFVMEFWGSVPDIYNIEIRTPGGETVPPLRLSMGQSVTYSFIYERSKVTVSNVLVEPVTGEELLIFRLQDPTVGIWNFKVSATGRVNNGTFHMWLPITQFLTSEVYFTEPDPYTTLTEPAMSDNVIAVSAYNDANNSFFIESGRGFSRIGQIRPDFAAPGVNVSTVYGKQTGSSLSAAISAGAVAQFFQWAVVEENNEYQDTQEIKNYLIRGSKDLQERFIGNAFMLNEQERERILKNPTGKFHHTQLTKPFYDKVKHLDDVTKMQYIDIHFWLIGDILLKADKMSMAHSLEVRVPFLDRVVFDVARKVPTEFKVTKENTKYAMRQAAHRYLPDMVAEKKKLGFPVPIRVWLREDKYYNIVKEAFHSPAAKEYFKTEEIMKYLDDHKAGNADNSRKIWTVYMFLVWHKQFF